MVKTILITGCKRGIGRASAIALANKGHKVIATTETKESADELNDFADKLNLSIKSFKLDITNAKDRNKILKYDLDVLINNAGMGETGSFS